MTTGTITYGSTSSPSYFSKSWVGGDGRYDGSGFSKNNNYTVSVIQLNSVAGSGIYWPSGGNRADSAWDNNADLEIQNSILASITGHQFNLGVALAEGKQTVDLVKDTALRIVKSIHSIRRGNVEEAARVLFRASTFDPHRINNFNRDLKKTLGRKLNTKDVSGTFLEIQYGWKPLMSDVYQASQAFSAIANRPRAIKYKASVTRKGHLDSLVGTFWKDSSDVLSTVRLSCLMREELSVPRQLGLIDPLSVAWEVTPWSFVADWFIPIGTYLQNLNQIPAISGGTFVRNYSDVIRTTRNGNNDLFAGAVSHEFYMNAVRTVSSSLSVPRPVFKSMDRALSPTHIWNAIALLHSNLR